MLKDYLSFDHGLKGENQKDVQGSPLLSVCVQTYQHAPYIRECLDGVLMQETSFPFELILGEDESNDGTREICQEYAERYPEKIRLFLRRREDVIEIEGFPTGRFNFISNLKASRGKYVAICEGDDYWTDKNKLEKQIQSIESEEHIVASSHVCTIINERGGNKKNRCFGLLESRLLDQKDMVNNRPFHTSSLVFEKSFLLDVIDRNTLKSHLSMDRFIYFWLTKFGWIQHHPEIYGVYRRHSSGLSSIGHKRNVLLNNIQFWKKTHRELNLFNNKLTYYKSILNEYYKFPSFSLIDKFKTLVLKAKIKLLR